MSRYFDMVGNPITRDEWLAIGPREPDAMERALDRQRDQLIKSMHVKRTGWTRQQWVDDARTLMDHPDGAITSLVNGHVLALIEEADALDRVRALCEEFRENGPSGGLVMVGTVRAAIEATS